MQVGMVYLELHNQVVSIVYKIICAKYELELPGSKWTTPPRLIENNQAKIVWNFRIQTDKMVVANQTDIVVVEKQDKKAWVVDLEIQSDSKVRKMENEKLKKYQGLKEMERVCGE